MEKEYIYPIILKNKRMPIHFALSDHIAIKRLTKNQIKDFFGIRQIKFIWGADCKFNIGHVIFQNYSSAKNKGKAHYEDLMRMFDGSDDLLASNYAIFIRSDYSKLDLLVEMVNIAFKLLKPTSTGGYLGFLENERSIHMHTMFPVPIHGPFDYIKLSKTDIVKLQQIYASLDSKKNDSKLFGALFHYSRALENTPSNRSNQTDIRYILLMIVLDLLYIPDGYSNANKMASRISSVLSDGISHGKICSLYKIRNEIIHDGKSNALTGRDFAELTEIVRQSLRVYLSDVNKFDVLSLKKIAVVECQKK